MRSTVLSESVLSSHLRPLSPKLSRPISCCIFSLNPSLKKHNFGRSSRNQSSIVVRYTREWCDTRHEGGLGHFVQKGSKNNNRIECHFTDCQNDTAMEESTSNPEECSFSYKLRWGHSLMRECNITVPSLISDASFGSLLKFMMLTGMLSLQGPQQAIASSDLASGLQSLPFLGDLGDISTGFASAFLLIFFSELGDKTFFIAALLAARNSAAVVFTGTFGALAAMTIISVVLGRTFHYVDEIIPFSFGGTDLPVDDIAAVCLLIYFGVSTLLDATSNDAPKAEEEQKEAELAVSKFSGNGAGILAAANTVISTFVLVFVAEWGDKSFFSTIALAAASSPLGVIAGALAGHGVATLLAVLGGSLLGTFLSEKAISYVGGVLFLVFAAVTLIEIVN